MKTIATHRKDHLEWTLFDFEEIKEVSLFKRKEYEFMPKGRYVVRLRVYDLPTNAIVHECEVLSSDYPCGYARNFPKQISQITEIGNFLGSNQSTWFPDSYYEK